ncbi:hypothetical protein CsSME_00041913 [Camellia sinensis var. sinensis]
MGKKPVKYCVVDAFTDLPFKGNPAAVCLLEEERDDYEWFRTVAGEFNLPMVCFLTRITDFESETHDSSHSSTNARFRLRWFIPATEVKLCGHGTLAASHFLFTSGLVNANRIEFLTLSGVLIAKRVPESQDCFLIELDFPKVPLADFDSAEVPSISKALGGASVIDLKITTTEDDLIVVLPSGKAVTDLLPQFDEIQRCPGRIVIITGPAPPGSGFDFFSRVFGPKMGINEDHVCGSAHCALATYWSKKLGKCDFVAYQASPRGGILNLHLDEKNQRVLLRGKAITEMQSLFVIVSRYCTGIYSNNGSTSSLWQAKVLAQWEIVNKWMSNKRQGSASWHDTCCSTELNSLVCLEQESHYTLMVISSSLELPFVRVYSIKIDAEQGKVTISGTVDPHTIITMLGKAGKKAELLSEMNNHNQTMQAAQPT